MVLDNFGQRVSAFIGQGEEFGGVDRRDGLREQGRAGGREDFSILSGAVSTYVVLRLS